MWCTNHQCHYVGWANRTREYYACPLRNKNRIPGSECALLKKDAIEQLILKVVTDEILRADGVRQCLVAIEQEDRREKEAVRGKVPTLDGEIKQVEEEITRYHNAIVQGVEPGALVDPMNRCFQKLSNLRSRLAQIEAQTHAATEITDELTNQVITSARQHLEEGTSEEIKLLLRDLIERVGIRGEEVAIRYTFRKPGTKVARVLAPQAGFEPAT